MQPLIYLHYTHFRSSHLCYREKSKFLFPLHVEKKNKLFSSFLYFLFIYLSIYSLYLLFIHLFSLFYLPTFYSINYFLYLIYLLIYLLIIFTILSIYFLSQQHTTIGSLRAAWPNEHHKRPSFYSLFT